VVFNPTYGFSQESPLHLNLQKHRIRKETRRMICPFCRHDDSRVVDSRPADDGSQIRRRRECTECGARFTTQETTLLNIVKRSGASEPFSREKVIAGVSKACQGRPVNDDDLALLAMRVEETLRATGQAEIEAQEVGLAILAPLRELDEVAYLRFASVYRSFSSLEDFEGEIALLRAAPSNPASNNSLVKNVVEVNSAAK
jgi:transcriptional repressor NrdR